LTGLLVLLVLSAVICSSQQESPQLFIEVSLVVSENVTISGRMTDMRKNAVPEGVVSIQVVDSLGSTIHIARVMSTADGGFSDTFALNPRIPVGTYTLYITASKEGYVDGRFVTSFLVSRRDFAVTITQSVIAIEQGENATFNIRLIEAGIFNDTVYLTLESALPRGLTHRFSAESVKLNASLTLTVASSPDTPVGNYTLLVVAFGGGRSHSASTSLVIVAKQRPVPVIWLMLLGGAAAIAGYVVLRRRSRRIIPVEDFEPTREDLEATRRLVELEQLRAEGKIDEKEYFRLRREHERTIERKG